MVLTWQSQLSCGRFLLTVHCVLCSWWRGKFLMHTQLTSVISGWWLTPVCFQVLVHPAHLDSSHSDIRLKPECRLCKAHSEATPPSLSTVQPLHGVSHPQQLPSPALLLTLCFLQVYLCSSHKNNNKNTNRSYSYFTGMFLKLDLTLMCWTQRWDYFPGRSEVRWWIYLLSWPGWILGGVQLLSLFLAAASLRPWMRPRGPKLCLIEDSVGNLSGSVKTTYSKFIVASTHPPPTLLQKMTMVTAFYSCFLISVLHFLPSLFHILAFLTMSLPLSPNESLALGVCSFHWVLISFAVGEVCEDPQGSYSSFWGACCR